MENMDNCFCHFQGFRVKDAEARQRIEVNEKKLQSEYAATPETLAEIVSSANAGATIKLAAGKYDRLTLKGVEGFPENLTIAGGAGVEMAGISITSGVLNDNLLWQSDVSNITLPGGLIIRDVTLTDSFSFRNACIDGLQLINLHIKSGGININPNSYKDKYGKDGASSTATRFSFQGAIVKNLLIKGCTIDDVTIANNDTNHAIYIRVAENITIQSNKITAATGNAIQIVAAGASEPVTGNIRICDNTILKSKEHAIRVYGLKDAYLFMVNNRITNCDLSGGVDKYIRVTDCENTFCKFNRRDADGYNYAEGNKIDVDNGIYVENTASYAKQNEIATVDFTNKVSFVVADDSDNENLTTLEAAPLRFEYNPLTGLVHFLVEVRYEGKIDKDGWMTFKCMGNPYTLQYMTGNYPVCAHRNLFSATFNTVLDGGLTLDIRAEEAIDVQGVRVASFSGWYFARVKE